LAGYGGRSAGADSLRLRARGPACEYVKPARAEGKWLGLVQRRLGNELKTFGRDSIWCGIEQGLNLRNDRPYLRQNTPSTMNGPLHIRLLPLVFLMALMVAGCKTPPEQKTGFEDEVLSEEASLAAIRYEVIDFADEFARTIEFSADQIESQATNPDILERALLWKMNGIPKALICLDHPSPVAGLLDLWTLAVQMDDYYRHGAGREAFGDLQPIANEGTTHLVRSIEKVMQKFARPESFEIARNHVTEFAASHPFEGDLFSSPSVTRALPERFVPTSGDVFSSMASLETEVRQLQAKSGLYMEHLPRQARWQAERLATDLVDQQVSAQVSNAFSQVAAERQVILGEIDRQRLEALEFLRDERETILEAVHQEVGEGFDRFATNTLVEVEALVNRERVATLAAIDRQRQQTLGTVSADLERVSSDTVDRAYSKVWLILVVVWLGSAGLLVLARFLFRPAAHPNRR
jgi:hypothetical protein